MAVQVIYTDEINRQRFTFTEEHLLNLRVTNGLSLAIDAAEVEVGFGVPSRSRRCRIQVNEVRGQTYSLFDGFVVDRERDYDPDRTIWKANTIAPPSEQFLIDRLLGTGSFTIVDGGIPQIQAWNFRNDEPYKSAIPQVGKTFRGLVREVIQRLVEPELTYADIADILYTEFGIVLHGTLLYPIWSYNNTVALTIEDIIARKYKEPNLANLPGGIEDVDFRNPYLRVDVNEPLQSLVQEDPVNPDDRKWLVKDNRTQTNREGSLYQIEVDKWLLEREAAEIEVTTPLRLDIGARTRVTFPAGTFDYDTPWIVDQVTYDWKAHTTRFKGYILGE